MSKYAELLQQATEKGAVEILAGVHLSLAESLTADQKDWDEDDSFKHFDLSNAPFWITTNNGEIPTEIHDADELKQFIEDRASDE